ncbi:hypothetical protein ACFL5Z_11735 [Planctomycetota bacterium]
MIPLTREQKELIFDYCIGLTSQEQAAEAKELIASNQDAQQIHSKFQATFALLDSLEPEPCPDTLAERTVGRLKDAASSSQDRLQQLLAGEQSRAVDSKKRILMGLGGRLAMAAMFVIAGSILLTSLNYIRYNSRVQQCKMQMGNIFRGLGQYIADFDGQQPALAAAPGDPWWKVGAQGDENHSNTRNMYLLVKGEYVKLSDYVCPGSKCEKTTEVTPAQIRTLKDFPSRNCVTYSFRVSCQRMRDGKLLCRKVVMADWNPLFEEMPDYNQSLQKRLTARLLTLNSINHRRRGQNVLFGDGRVVYMKTRLVGADDIFTLQDTDVYRGYEVPSCETDFFLAP